MGAWGTGSFENDTAMDWAGEVRALPDVSKPFERLKRESDVHPDGGDMPLDSDFASELIAAAECVAMMLGRKVPDFPEALAKTLSGAPEPDALLFHQARNAVLSVIRYSELAQLWQEASEGEDTNEWLAETSELIERLNPEIDYVQSLPEVDEADMVKEQEVCAFCRKPIAQGEFYGMSVTEYGDIFESSRILPIHLKCLNARLHHSTMVIGFREDLTKPADLDKL